VNESVALHRRRALTLVAAVGIRVAVGLMVVAVLVQLVLGGAVALVAIPIAIALGAVVAWWSLRRAEPTALRLTGAVAADPHHHARLHNLVEGICVSIGLPKPDLYVVDDPGRNALATGRSPRQASLVVTTGLLDALTRVELEGIVAQLLGRVRDGWVVPATVAVTTVGARVAAADRAIADAPAAEGSLPPVAGLLLAGSSLQARALHRAVGGHPEGLADRAAIRLTRYPPGLLAALEKLEEGGTVVRTGGLATAHLWVASPLDVNLPGRRGELARQFDRHPPLAERIAALREY
jgi:heat shock protein HtpX